MTNQNQSEGLSPQEFWISKGNSKFCSDLVYDYESDSYVKCSPDGFYDVVSEKDTIEGGIHVVDFSSYQALKEENERLNLTIQALSKNNLNMGEELDRIKRIHKELLLNTTLK